MTMLQKEKDLAVTEVQEGKIMKKLLLIFALIFATLLTGCAKEEATNEASNEYPFEIIDSQDIIEAEIILENGKTNIEAEIMLEDY